MPGRQDTFSFVKAQISSLVSTVSDFTITGFLTSVVGCWYLFSSVTGAILGGVLNFFIGRHWVFKNRKEGTLRQGFKYSLIWLGSIALNASGVYLLTDVFRLHYMISKCVVSLLVGVFFNYYLQSNFVFNYEKSN